MTRALVVYESMFGNTESIARAITDGLGGLDVECVHVRQAPDAVPSDLDLLVIGGPTHAFGLTRPGTRAGAVQQAEKAGRRIDSFDAGIREWIEGLGPVGGRTRIATFDTKIRRFPGSAAKAAARRLRRNGARVATSASFYVSATPGPLRDGEEDRARAWGADLGAKLATRDEMAQ